MSKNKIVYKIMTSLIALCIFNMFSFSSYGISASENVVDGNSIVLDNFNEEDFMDNIRSQGFEIERVAMDPNNPVKSPRSQRNYKVFETFKESGIGKTLEVEHYAYITVNDFSGYQCILKVTSYGMTPKNTTYYGTPYVWNNGGGSTDILDGGFKLEWYNSGYYSASISSSVSVSVSLGIFSFGGSSGGVRNYYSSTYQYKSVIRFDKPL